jgi:hypothetical protein
MPRLLPLPTISWYTQRPRICSLLGSGLVDDGQEEAFEKLNPVPPLCVFRHDDTHGPEEECIVLASIRIVELLEIMHSP